MLGSTFVTQDIHSSWTSLPELPDVASHVVTLNLQNQDGFASQYGFRGTDYDYKVLIRNSKESPKVGLPLITRHNAEFQLTKRPTISGGVVTPAIPYVVGMTVRLPETGTSLIARGLAAAFLLNMIAAPDASVIAKMFNFES